MLGAEVSAVTSSSSIVADPRCNSIRIIFSSRSSVFTDMKVCRSQEYERHSSCVSRRNATVTGSCSLRGTCHFFAGAAGLRRIEMPKREFAALASQFGQQANFAWALRCRVENSGPAHRHFCQNEEDAE